MESDVKLAYVTKTPKIENIHFWLDTLYNNYCVVNYHPRNALKETSSQMSDRYGHNSHNGENGHYGHHAHYGHYGRFGHYG